MILKLLILLPLMAWAQTQFCGDIPGTANINRVAEWTEIIDRSIKVPLPENSNTIGFTKFGNAVDGSCGHKRIPVLEKGIALSITQAEKCWRKFQLGDATAITGILRNTRFMCREGSNNVLAANKIWNPLHPKEHTSFRRNYLITFSLDELDNSDVYDHSSTLFHEALHNTTANNRLWHNRVSQKKKRGCKNSMFEDRVYMIEAACFPKGLAAMNFYAPEDGAAFCPDVCLNALTGKDYFSYVNFTGKGKESLHGKRYSSKDAQIICSKIHDFGKRMNHMKAQGKKLLERQSKFMSYVDTLPADKSEKINTSLQVLYFYMAAGRSIASANQEEIEKFEGHKDIKNEKFRKMLEEEAARIILHIKTTAQEDKDFLN